MKSLVAGLLTCVLAGPLAAQDVSVSASVSETTIGTEETLVYTIRVEGSDGTDLLVPAPPESSGLALLQTNPGTQRSVQIINGQVSQSFSFNWTYRPTKEGTAHIGSTSVTAGDKTLKTDALDIRVVPQAQRPAVNRTANRRRDPFAGIFGNPPATGNAEPEAPDENDIFIRAVPGQRTVWQNEQVVVEYRLYFREGIQLRQSRLTDSWDAEGFWREELDVDTRPVPRMVVENGLRYNTITLKKAAVFPTRAGDMTIDPLRIESEAMMPGGRGDPLRSMFSLRTSYTPVELSSPSVTIHANQLPDGAPTGFSGAVGDYRVTSHITRSELEVGGSLEVTMTISGSGNLATLEGPSLVAPAAFDKYEPRVETNLNRAGNLLSGTKSFTYLLIPRSNGTFEIPPVEFSWFDSRAERYRTYRSNPMPVRVTGTATTPAVVAATTNGLPIGDFAPPIRDASEWIRTGSRPIHTRSWPYMAILLPVLVLVGAALAQRHRDRILGDASFARGRRAHPLSRKHLKQAQVYLDNGETAAFFEELDRAVLGFIGNRLNVAERGLTRENLDRLLSDKGVDRETRQYLENLLELCDLGRYAPSTMDRSQLERAMDDASALIPDLDEQTG